MFNELHISSKKNRQNNANNELYVHYKTDE